MPFDPKTIAKQLEGRWVRVTTRRGNRYEGKLWTAKHASLVIGYHGPVAYGGIVNIEEIEEF